MKKKIAAKKKEHPLTGKLIHVRVGDNDRAASPGDIKDAQRAFDEALKGIKCRCVVTHHAIQVYVL